VGVGNFGKAESGVGVGNFGKVGVGIGYFTSCSVTLHAVLRRQTHETRVLSARQSVYNCSRALSKGASELVCCIMILFHLPLSVIVILQLCMK